VIAYLVREAAGLSLTELGTRMKRDVSTLSLAADKIMRRSNYQKRKMGQGGSLDIKLSPIIVFMIFFASSPTMADDDYVRFAKSLSAEKYDKSLPSVPVEQWLTSALPRGIAAAWGDNVTDCGEQTGNPAIDSERDMPLCAEIELKQKDKSVGYLLLFVGTEKKAD